MLYDSMYMRFLEAVKIKETDSRMVAARV
jgi:hypothetical protein